MTQSKENKRRARFAGAAIESMESADPYDPEMNVCDMLANIRHLCDSCGYDFSELNRKAAEHHAIEKEENKN